LTKPFCLDEIKAAVWDCDNFKSTGLDGIHMGFIKDFWSEMKDDLMRFISDFYRNARLSKGINNISIALIPKVDNPQSLHEFRPIALVVGVSIYNFSKLFGKSVEKGYEHNYL